MVRFGLLGAGRIGKLHGGNIAASPDAELVAVADVVTEAADALAAVTGAEARSADDIIGASDIDAVLIGTSTDTHADFIEQAVRAGKAVLCEKPVDLDAGRIETCLEVVEASGKPLMVGFNRRFDPNFAAHRRNLGSPAKTYCETGGVRCKPTGRYTGQGKAPGYLLNCRISVAWPEN